MSQKAIQSRIIILNAGSSSIKFSLYQTTGELERELYGKIERIGLTNTDFSYYGSPLDVHEKKKIDASDHRSAANFLIDWLDKQVGFDRVRAVGHRVVQGMDFTEPQKITDNVLDKLQRITSYDPDHLPQEIELIKAFKNRHPKLPQVACFDTSFHSKMPRIAGLLPIPRHYYDRGIKRYGFHGLSYTYLAEELARRTNGKSKKERVILAHLGNGASLAAVKDGQCLDTSMGFTPASGLVMGTRTGDLDPGVAWYLMKTEHLTPGKFNDLINHESGLLGVSETSSDMRDLLDRQAGDQRAAEAVELFCYQARKWIGAFAAVLGGLDSLVFAGGIGENSPEIRQRICEGLAFLGIEIDKSQNHDNANLISLINSPVMVHVINTNEELVIAEAVARVLNITVGKDGYRENIKR